MLRSMTTRCLGFRGLHTTNTLRIDPKTVEEVRIPVPWGHIAGKWWGSSCEQPILAFHGLFDNAASFDLLAPHLDVPALLALDLPGHGLSSHFPEGMFWSWTVMMSAIRYLAKHHFKWPTVSFMGHSYGSCLALTYAGLYPKETQALINIDCARASNAIRNDYVDVWRRNTERMLSLESKTTRKPLKYEEAVSKMSNRLMPLTKEQCQIIASRSLSNIGCGKYIFNEDLRMSCPSIGRNTLEAYDALIDNITCPVLNIVATHGILIGDFMAAVKAHNEVMKKKCAHFECQVINGQHHVHMDNPEEVATAINNFFKTVNQPSVESQ